MNELIKIEMNENQEIIVSGRELHKGLGVESRYNDWFKRMLKYGFEENLDYIAITQKKVTAQGNETTYIDHVIKLDMAKEICMLQRNDKGKKFRKYFIECEKRLKEQQLPQLTRKEELQLQLFSEDSLEVVNAHKELVKIEVEEATKPLLGKIEEEKQEIINSGIVSENEFADYEKDWYGQSFLRIAPVVSIEEKLDESGYWTEEPIIHEIQYGQDGYVMPTVVDSDAVTYNELAMIAFTLPDPQ